MDPELYNAAASGDIAFVETRICDEDSVFLSQTTPKRNTLLHVAAEFKQTEFIKKVCQRCRPSLIWQQNSKGDTALHVAARLGCCSIVNILIGLVSSTDVENRRNTVDKDVVGKVNGDMDTALHCAVRNGHHEAVRSLLVAYPETASFVNNADESALYLAVAYRFPEIARLIVDLGPNSFSYKGPNGFTALHLLAFSTPDPTLTRTIIEQRPEITKESDPVGWTPLHYAAGGNKVENLKILLEYDSSAIYMPDHEGDSALHIAAFRGYVNIIEAILQCRPDASELTDGNGRTALHVAVTGKQANVVKYILNGLRLTGLINQPDNDGNTPLHLAVMFEAYNIVTLLVQDNRINVHATNKKLESAFAIFCSSSRTWGFKDAKVLYLLNHSLLRASVQLWASDRIKKKMKTAHPARTRENVHKHQGENTFLEVYLLVAMLIATVSFAAAFTLPGGYDETGVPVLKDKTGFKAFVVFDTLAFTFSLSAVLLQLMTAEAYCLRVRYRHLQKLLIANALVALALAFALDIYVVLTKSNGLGFTAFIIIDIGSVIFFCCWFVDPRAYGIRGFCWSERARNFLYR